MSVFNIYNTTIWSLEQDGSLPKTMSTLISVGSRIVALPLTMGYAAFTWGLRTIVMLSYCADRVSEMWDSMVHCVRYVW